MFLKNFFSSIKKSDKKPPKVLLKCKHQYRFTGQTFPNCDFGFELQIHSFRSDSGVEYSGSATFENNQLEVIIDSDEEDVFTLRNLVETAIGSQLDCCSYISGSYTNLFIDFVESENGARTVFLPNHSTFYSQQTERPFHGDPIKLAQLAGLNNSLRIAMFSITEAIRNHDLTGMFAYRAIEAAKDHFGKSDWNTINKQLRLHRSWADELTQYSTPQRHGGAKYMSADVRETMLYRAYGVVDRLIIYIENDDGKPLTHLDELYCDGKGTLGMCLDLNNKNHK